MGAGDVELARRAYAAFNRGDVEGALVHLDPEIEWHSSPQFHRGGRVFHGHEGVRQLLALFAESLDGFQTQPQRFLDAGGAVVVPVRLEGRLPGSHEEVVHEIVHVWTVRDHRAVRLEVYATLEEACPAVGIAVPADTSGSTAEPGMGRPSR
jgi:ketosteroid isomerase-like protein